MRLLEVASFRELQLVLLPVSLSCCTVAPTTLLQGLLLEESCWPLYGPVYPAMLAACKVSRVWATASSHMWLLGSLPLASLCQLHTRTPKTDRSIDTFYL